MKQRGNFVQIKATHRKDRILNNLNASFIYRYSERKWIVGKVLCEILQCFSYTFTNWVVKNINRQRREYEQ